MPDASLYLTAIMEMATGILYAHGEYDDSDGVVRGPLDHVGVSGSALDEKYREFILRDPSITRDAFVDLVRANPEEGVALSVYVGDGEVDLDVFVPLTASVTDAYTLVKTALDAYIEKHFG